MRLLAFFISSFLFSGVFGKFYLIQTKGKKSNDYKGLKYSEDGSDYSAGSDYNWVGEPTTTWTRPATTWTRPPTTTWTTTTTTTTTTPWTTTTTTWQKPTTKGWGAPAPSWGRRLRRRF